LPNLFGRVSVGCNICSDNKGYIHRLLIIDTKAYLLKLKDSYPDEYSLALIDNDWLLMPCDPMVGMHANGFQSRIPIADFWTVDFYKYE